MKAYHLNVAAVLGAAMLLHAAHAQQSGDLSYLAGARAAGGEAQLEDLGYIHIKTQKGDDRAWNYWWHPRDHQCLSVAVMDGRIDSVTSTPAADCDQKNHADDNQHEALAPEVSLNDLFTQRAEWADVQIQKRGFTTLSAYHAGNTDYTIRSNTQTGQCVQVAVEDGRVRYIAKIKPAACRK